MEVTEFLKIAIGLVLGAFIVIGFILLIQQIISIIFPGPGVVTKANFERLTQEIDNLKDGETINVPFYMVPSDSTKVVTEKEDVDCYPKSCLCLCEIDTKEPNAGCSKWRKKQCYSGYEVSIENPQNIDIRNFEKKIGLLEVTKGNSKIIVKDTAYMCQEGKVCCQYVTVAAEAGAIVTEDWQAGNKCVEPGVLVPCSYCK